jgi:hypothetical protein
MSLDMKPSVHEADAEAGASHINVKSEAVHAAPEDFDFTPEEQKKIIRRLDYRLVLLVGAMYCISLMDRTNLGAANIAGMAKELQLVGNRYVSVTDDEPVCALLC